MTASPCLSLLNWGLGFVAHEYVDWGAGEVPVLTYLIFKIAAIRLLDPLR